MVAAGDGVCDRDQVAVKSSSISGNDKENTGLNSGVDGRRKVPAVDGVNVSSSKNFEPHDGMEFESKEEAFSFYKDYAKSVGFATIIKASRRSRISGKFIDAKFVCTRYGNKRESGTDEILQPFLEDGTTNIPIKRKRGRINRPWPKTDCKACMHVKRRQDGSWIIRSFIKEHNHEVYPDQASYLRGQRSTNLGDGNVGALHAIRDRRKKTNVSMSRQASGNEKVENQKGSMINQSGCGKHLGLEEGDAQVILDYCLYMQDENPNFYYAIDFNKQQCLGNVFWVDAKGRLDYGSFSDVVFFDTTYIKNEYKLPFAPFIGVNHHFQFLSLGCALIADETISTFIWLMRAWRRAMGGQAPRVILSDQDDAVKEAIAEVFPDSCHCYCLWHVLSKLPEKLSHVMRQHENFMTKFNKCIFKSLTDEQFEKRWRKMVEGFNLRNHIWFQSLYEDRRKWMPTYMREIFFAGLSTIQRSESINSFFDKHIQRKTTLKEFLDQYKVILQDKYEDEAKADFDSWHKQPGLKSPSPFGKQMAALYTHAIFKKFQVEVLGVVACHPKKDGEDGATVTFKVQDFEENQDFIVEWDEPTLGISCFCRLFEYYGFLCRHAMIVLQMYGVHNIPSQYILKRWTKDAKSRQKLGQNSDMVEYRARRYSTLCQQAFRLGNEGSLSQDTYNIALNALEDALRKCESVNNSIRSAMEPSSPSAHGLDDLNEATQGNNTNSANERRNTSERGKVHLESEVINVGMHDSWQPVGRSNLQEPTLGCSYETQESRQRMEQLNPRAATLDGYFGSPQIMRGMLSSVAQTHDDYYSNRQHMQGLGQLNSIAPIHGNHYLDQQRMHVLGQLHFRPQTIQNCFDIEDGLRDMVFWQRTIWDPHRCMESPQNICTQSTSLESQFCSHVPEASTERDFAALLPVAALSLFLNYVFPLGQIVLTMTSTRV